MTINNDLAQHLRKCRLAAGLSQAELGRLVGIDRRLLSSIECGRRSPGYALVDAVAQCCGCAEEKKTELLSLAHAALPKVQIEADRPPVPPNPKLYKRWRKPDGLAQLVVVDY